MHFINSFSNYTIHPFGMNWKNMSKSLTKCIGEEVASCRFELQSQDPESRMIDHYTTRLYRVVIGY